MHDPARGRRAMPLDEASRHYTGVAMEFSPTSSFKPRDEREQVKATQLLGVARGLKGTIAQILVLSLALEVFAIAMPFFLQLVVDRVLVGRDRDLLTVLGVAFGALVVITVAVTAVRAWVSVYLSTNLNLRLLSTLFAHLVKLPLTWFEKRNIGDIVSKFRSVDAVQRTLTTTFVETVVDGLMVVLTLIVMAWYSLTLTAVVIGAAVLYVAARWILYYPQRYATDEQISHEAKSSTHFIETLRGMMAIKLNLRENERRAAYQNLVVDQINAGVKVQNVGIAQRAASALIFGLENVAIDLAGGHRRDGRQVLRGDALRLPRLQAGLPGAGERPGGEVERLPHAGPARRAHRRHRAGGGGERRRPGCPGKRRRAPSRSRPRQ